jgi:integrase
MPSSRPPLSPSVIDKLEPRAKDYELSDSAAPGLVLRVTANGTKVFRWYVNSIGRRITIGRWSKTPAAGHVTLGEARTWLERLREGHRTGKLAEVEAELPARRTGASAEPTRSGLTVKDVAEDFGKYLDRERRRPEQGRRPLDYDIVPRIGEKPIASVTVQDCRAIVEAVVARGSPVQAGAVLAVMRQFFNFAVDRADIESSPAERLRNPRALGVIKNVSQRFLSPAEIAKFWQALDAYRGITPTVRNGLKLLLLTAVRSGELLAAKWENVDSKAGTWSIPPEDQKLTLRREQTARPFIVPIAPTAARLFEELRALAGAVGSPYVMASFHPAARGEPISEKALNHAMRRLFEGKEPLLRFRGERPTPHDLRRSVRTHMGETLGIPWHVAERVLNHSLGTIAATYDVGDYLAERRAALEKWGAYVERLVAPGEAKVAFLTGKAVR